MSSGSAVGEWSMFGHNLAQTGSTGSSAAVPKGTLTWVFATGREILASPVVANGVVYVGSIDGIFYAVDARTGDELWRFAAENWIESSAAVAGGVVYFGSNDGRLYALDAQTGEKLWEYPAKFSIKSSPALANANVYFTTGEYMIYALNARTGEMLWTFETKGDVSASPVVANGIVYVGDLDSFFYGLDAVTGRRRLHFRAYGGTAASAAVSGTTVYFANTHGVFFAVDGMARNWPNEQGTRFFFYRIYVQILGAIPPKWLMPPAQTGLLWWTRLGGPLYSSPAFFDDRLFIGTANRLLAVNVNTHGVDWEFTTGDIVSSSPAVMEGVVFAGSGDGNLYAVEADSGKVGSRARGASNGYCAHFANCRRDRRTVQCYDQSG